MPAESEVTLFDSVFGFVQQCCRQCADCGHVETWCKKISCLEIAGCDEGLSYPESLASAYLRWCCPNIDGEMRACSSSVCYGKITRHVLRVRLFNLPQLLSVRVRDMGSRGFCPEDYVSFPFCGKAELVGVLYDRGVRAGRRRYFSACLVLSLIHI